MKIDSPSIITQLNVSGSATITGSLNVIGPISSSGNFVPTTSTQDLGTVTNPWRELFISTGSINFSDGTETVKTLTLQNLITSESLSDILTSTLNAIVTRVDTIEGKTLVSGSSQLNNSTLSGMNISGSFSGSFQGDGSQLTGLAGSTKFQNLGEVSGSVNINLDEGNFLDLILSGNVSINWSSEITSQEYIDFTIKTLGQNEFEIIPNAQDISPEVSITSSTRERNLIKGVYLGDGNVVYSQIIKLEDRNEIYVDSEFVVGGYVI